jgi:hypothetical protein
VRVIVLLLAVVMMAGIAGQAASASPDAISAVDETPDVDTPVVVESAVVQIPERQPPMRVDGPAVPTHGRMHAVLVFRPPRLVTSR